MKNKKVKSQSPVPPIKDRIVPAEFTFPDAIRMVIDRKKVRRKEWEDKEEYVLLRDNFLMIHRKGQFFTLIVSEGDMLAMDWMVLD